MRIIAWDDLGTAKDGFGEKGIALSIGVFDGVHRGHRELLSLVMGRPGELERGVVTFADNPKRVLRPESFRGEISSLRQRLAAFSSMGLAFAALIDFSSEFSTLSGRQFLARLAEGRNVRYVAIGENFHCGHRMDTDSRAFAAMARERGVEVDTVPPLTLSGETVSSSRIREAIAGGRLAEAARLLGRPHSLDLGGIAEQLGGGRWRAGSAGCRQILPPDGEYRALLVFGGKTSPARMRVDAAGGSLRWEEGGSAEGAELELVCDRIDIDKE